MVDDPAKDHLLLPDEFLPAQIKKDCATVFEAAMLHEGSYTFQAPAIRGATRPTQCGACCGKYVVCLCVFLLCARKVVVVCALGLGLRDSA